MPIQGQEGRQRGGAAGELPDTGASSPCLPLWKVYHTFAGKSRVFWTVRPGYLTHPLA